MPDLPLLESPASVSDVLGVSRLWQDAANIFEAASAADGDTTNLAILVDARHGLRIVDPAGWNLDALRREYQAETAYCVTRDATSITVEGQNGSESCTLKKNVPVALLTKLGSGFIPHHLVRTDTQLLSVVTLHLTTVAQQYELDAGSAFRKPVLLLGAPGHCGRIVPGLLCEAVPF